MTIFAWITLLKSGNVRKAIRVAQIVLKPRGWAWGGYTRYNNAHRFTFVRRTH